MRRERGGEYGSRTPVEARETKVVDSKTEVGIPFKQALILGITAMVVCATGVLATRAMGPAIFWVIVFILGTTNITYFLVVESKSGYSVTLPEFVTGILFCLSSGGVGLCAWKISEYAFPTWKIEQGWLNVSIALTFVGSLVTFCGLSLAFTQELIQRSFFMEEAIWGAVGKGLTAKFLRSKGRDPIIVHSSGEEKKTRAKAKVEPRGEAETITQVPDEWAKYNPQWTPEEVETGAETEAGTDVEDEVKEENPREIEIRDMREFLVLGNKDKFGYGRAKWKNVELSSGTVVTERMARRWVDMFREAEMMAVIDGKTQLVVSLNDAIRSIS